MIAEMVEEAQKNFEHDRHKLIIKLREKIDEIGVQNVAKYARVSTGYLSNLVNRSQQYKMSRKMLNRIINSELFKD